MAAGDGDASEYEPVQSDGRFCSQSGSIPAVTCLKSAIPEEIEIYRDRNWCREPELRIEEPLTAESF